METLGKVFSAIITTLIGALISAYVFMKLWSWIIVPIFGMQILTMGQSYALAFFISYIKFSKKDAFNDEDEDFTEKIIKSLIYYILYGVLFLGLGYIAQLFV